MKHEVNSLNTAESIADVAEIHNSQSRHTAL